MSSSIKTPIDADQDSASAAARADLLRRAELQGVEPFTSLKEFAGDPTLTADFDVDEFLHQVRRDRDHASNGQS